MKTVVKMPAAESLPQIGCDAYILDAVTAAEMTVYVMDLWEEGNVRVVGINLDEDKTARNIFKLRQTRFFLCQRVRDSVTDDVLTTCHMKALD